MPTNFTTYQEITDYLVSKNVYKLTGKDSQIVYKPNPKSIGDNMVGFMSQIGWTEDNSSSPNKKYLWKKSLLMLIQMVAMVENFLFGKL